MQVPNSDLTMKFQSRSQDTRRKIQIMCPENVEPRVFNCNKVFDLFQKEEDITEMCMKAHDRTKENDNVPLAR